MKLLITGGAGFTRPHRQRAIWYYTYVLKSLKDGNLYIGWTDKLKERLQKHNTGRVSSTSRRAPLKPVYY